MPPTVVIIAALQTIVSVDEDDLWFCVALPSLLGSLW